MTHIIFARGLQGDKALERANEFDAKSNLAAVQGVALQHHSGFVAPDYQYGSSDKTRFPTLSAMAATFARACNEQAENEGGPGLIVASSVGVAVALQALPFMQVRDLILFKGVYDALFGIERQALAESRENELRCVFDGRKKQFDLQVSGEGAGVFPLKREHLSDGGAYRFLSRPNEIDRLHTALGDNPLRRVMIIAAENDPYSPPEAAQAFAKLVTPLAETVSTHILPGGHNDNHTDWLKKKVALAIGQGWGA